MRELENIKNVAYALDIDKQFEKAESFLKTQGINNPFFDGFYGHTVDIVGQIEQFKRDYSGSPLVVCLLSLEKSKKAYTMIDGQPVEIDPPTAQEKTYVEVSGRNKTDRATNFYSIKYLQEIANKTGLKLETFEFGKTIIHLTILYDDLQPVDPPLIVEIVEIPPSDPDKGIDSIPPGFNDAPKDNKKPNSKVKGDK